jgi:hypothetical protein
MTIASIFLILAIIAWFLAAFRVPAAVDWFPLGWAFVGIAWLCGAAVLHL